jgi:hypothetical protein
MCTKLGEIRMDLNRLFITCLFIIYKANIVSFILGHIYALQDS